MIYLDHAATTPLRREVLDAMLPLLTDGYGNPSSAHAAGRRARAALDEAHETVARCINAEAREIVFTAGGTEAINLAIKGAAWAGKAMGHRIITSAVEHHAALHAVQHLEHFGFEVVLPAGRPLRARSTRTSSTAALTDRTILVTLQIANNEVGTIQPVAELVRAVEAPGCNSVLIHLDAVQSAPYQSIDVRELGADLVSLAATSSRGPRVSGRCGCSSGTTVLPQTQGGSQERYRRAGTENVAGAVGHGDRLRAHTQERPRPSTRLRRAARPAARRGPGASTGVELTGHPRERLPGHLSVIVRARRRPVAPRARPRGHLLLDGLRLHDRIGRAVPCADGMGYPEEEARGALRMSLGRTTTEDGDRSGAEAGCPP